MISLTGEGAGTADVMGRARSSIPKSFTLRPVAW
jgi:hypothetical protein